MTNRTRTRLIALLAALSLLTTACFGSSDEADDGDDVASVAETVVGADSASGEDGATDAAEAAGAEDETDPSEEPEEPEESEEPDPASDSVSGECIVGDWIIDEVEMQAYYNALASNAGGLDMTFMIDGHTQMSFSDAGTLTYVPAFTLQLDAGGVTGEGVAGGELSGTYALEDGIITSEITENGLTIEVSVSGITMTQDDLGGAFSSIPIASAPYHCTDEGPAIEFQTGGPTHLVQLTRA